MTTSEIIDRYLKEKNMSRRQLAKKAKIPPSSLQSAMERDGKMSFEMIRKIAEVLDVDPTYLYPTDAFSEFYKGTKIPKYDEAGRRLSEWTLSSLDDGIAKLTTSDEAMTFLTTYLEASGKDQQALENVGYTTLKLNSTGQKKAADLVEDLAKIPDYQKDPKK